MALKTVLIDGYGNGNKAKVNGEGELGVVVHPHPPKDELEAPLPYRAYMTLNGDGTTNDMLVNGSVTNQEFLIKAEVDRDIYLNRISVVIADVSAVLNKFGNITALTNGCELKWVTEDFGEVVIHEALKTNFDFVRLGGGQPAFGDGAGAFRASNVTTGAGAEAYIPQIDFDEIFGVQWGLRLRRGTRDRLSFIIKDDVSTIDQFDIVAYGIKF